MSEAPSTVSRKQLEELSIRVMKKERGEGYRRMVIGCQ